MLARHIKNKYSIITLEYCRKNEAAPYFIRNDVLLQLCLCRLLGDLFEFFKLNFLHRTGL